MKKIAADSASGVRAREGASEATAGKVIPRDALFRAQVETYRLRWHCEDCAHFEGDGCAHGLPSVRHREAVDHEPDAPLAFCKEHELI
ncbi:MAG: hypothetical protein MUE69_06445 [Myxococcota bacterium]|jgi:hypothetical protein|nr:hypothetical protein [Myxococcota bacterium]